MYIFHIPVSLSLHPLMADSETQESTLAGSASSLTSPVRDPLATVSSHVLHSHRMHLVEEKYLVLAALRFQGQDDQDDPCHHKNP